MNPLGANPYQLNADRPFLFRRTAFKSQDTRATPAQEISGTLIADMIYSGARFMRWRRCEVRAGHLAMSCIGYVLGYTPPWLPELPSGPALACYFAPALLLAAMG